MASVFAGYPAVLRDKLMDLRQLIFDTAQRTEGVGELEETLRWGEPSYVTRETKSGSTVRIASKKPGQYAVYFHCQTDLISRFKGLYPDEFEYEGNRSILFASDDTVPKPQLGHCISMALTYHLDKPKARRAKRRR